MSMVEWDTPMSLVSPQGTLLLNQGDPRYVVDKGGCQAKVGIRATKDNVPQQSGSIIHKRYKTGYEIQLRIVYWQSMSPQTPACDGDATVMHDGLMLHLEAMLDADGRLIWTPTGLDSRFFESCRWLQEVTVEAQNAFVSVQFTLDSPFPYSLDLIQTVSTFDTTDFLVNTGTATMYPVIKVHAGGSPLHAFIITNEDNLDAEGDAKQIAFSSTFAGASAIPAGQYVEINTFRNTVYLNGNGANYLPGIDVENSDFWGLLVGSNEITVTGDGTTPQPTIDILWQAAWA